MMALNHKVALVTGASRGLGRAIGEALLSRGVAVGLLDVLQEDGERTAAELSAQHGADKVMFVMCDVSKQEQLTAAWNTCEAKLGKPDLLVNNAGIADENNWQRTISVNLGGCIAGTLLAMERMGKASGGEGGRVVNVSSIAGVKNIPFGPIYSASKSGIVGFSRALGHPLHLSLSGVQVQCICPAMIQTPFFIDAMKTPFSTEIAKIAAKAAGTLQYMSPETVATALISLIEGGANGAVMVVEPEKEPYYVDASVLP